MIQSSLSAAVSEGNCFKFNEFVKVESNIRFIIQRDGLLHMACRYGHFEIVKALIKIGAQCDLRYGNNERLALHEACAMGNEELVALMAEKSRDYIDSGDYHGLTAAHICTMHGELASLRILEAHGASFVVKDNEGMQLIHWAAKRNHSSIIRYLFELNNDLNMVCFHGRSPIHYAAMHNNLSALQCLIKCHADIALGDLQGATPIHLAAKHGSLQCLRFLASLKIPVTVRQHDGKTPAHLAALAGSYECLHWLLDNGQDCTVMDDELNTIGHMAVRSGKGEVMFCYLHHNGTVDSKNNLGEDMSQIARRYGHPLKYDMAKKAEIVCPMCQLESNKNEWDQIHAPSAVVQTINKSQRSLFQSPLGSYSEVVRHHNNVFQGKKAEMNRRNLETINLGKETPKKDKMEHRKAKSGSGYRDLITRYYGEFVSN